MNLINNRTGFFVKQQQSTKVPKKYYFFVDNEYRLFYTSSHLTISRLVNQKSIQEISEKFLRNEIPFVTIGGNKINSVKVFDYELQQVPQTRCFDVQISQVPQKQYFKSLLIFGMSDDDIQPIFEFFQDYERNAQQFRQSYKKPAAQVSLVLEPILQNTNSLPEPLADNAQALLTHLAADLLAKDAVSQEDEKLNQQSHVVNEQEGIMFSGKLRNGAPHGQGTRFFNNQGVSYIGEFRNGKKHGLGYFVNSNLDTIYCEFINDQPVGI